MRIGAMLLAAALMAGLTGRAWGQEDNRAPNPGFEQAADGLPAGWSPSVIGGDRALIRLQYIDRPRGGKCVTIDSRDPEAKAGWSAAEPIAVVPGQQVTVRAQVRLDGLQPGPGGGDGFVITCHFYDRTSYLSWSRSPGLMRSQDWATEEFQCRVPDGASSLVLGVRLSRCTGHALVDDVALYTEAPERAPEAERYGLQPGEPAATLSVAMLTGAGLERSRQLIDLLNREGIAAVAEDSLTVERFPAEAAALREFACVLVGALNAETGAGLLSAAQTAAILQYTRDGGGLVACAPAVAGTPLAQCFAAQIGEPVRGWHFIPETADASHPILADVITPWPGFGSKPQESTCYHVQAQDEAHLLAMVPEEVAGPGVPFLLCNDFGDGRAVLMNSSWVGQMASEFVTWLYAPRLLAQMVRWAAAMQPLPAAAKTPLPDPHEPVPYGGRWHGATAAPEPPALDPSALPEETLRLDELAPREPVEEPIGPAPEINEADGATEVRFGNGVRLVMHHAAQVELWAPDGTRLTAEPDDERPLIVTSGTEPTELVTDLEAGASEPQIFRAPIDEGRLLGERCEYRDCRPGAGGGVTFVFRLETGGKPATLRWSFLPRSVQIEGRSWHGVGDRYEIDSGEHFIDSVVGRYPWRIGETVTDDRTMRLACYSRPRGWYEMPIDISAASDPHNAWSFFASGQPFHVLGGAEGTLLLYYDQPTLVRARALTRAGRDAVYFDNRVVIGRRRGTLATPRQWMLFCADLPLTPNTWMQAYDHVRHEYEARFGVSQSRPLPCGQMRMESLGTRGRFRGRTVRMQADLDLRKIADWFLPLAAERGIRRVDVGTIANPEHPLDPEAQPERAAAARYLFDQAHSLGIQALVYWRTSYWNQHARLVVEHPEWWNRTRAGEPLTGFGNLVNLSLRSGWYEWSRDRLIDLRKTIGIDGVWFDTLTAGMDAINYAEEQPQPAVPRGIEYFRELRDAGLDFWVEGMHPLALDSYWYRHEKYAPFEGHEFCLFESSLYADGTDSLIYLDPFRLVAFRAPMMADLTELAVAQDPITRRQARCNRIFNAADQALGEVLAIRSTGFGSVWFGTRGYAVFALEDHRVTIDGLGGDGWQVAIPEGRGGSLTCRGVRATGHLLSGEVAIITRRAD